MNKTVKIFAGAAVLASFAACSQKIDFETFDYARLEATSYTFNEDAGTVTIPVYANKGASGTVNFEVIENTAKVGTNFTVEPANGSLNIGGGQSAITLKITNQVGVFTGDVNFTIRLTGASDGLTVGGIYAARVTIKDLDHPLSDILGNYVAKGISDAWGDVYDIAITVAPVDGSVSEVTVSNICPYSVSAGYPHMLRGYVNDSKTEIHIADWQSIYGTALMFVAMDEDENEVDELILQIGNGTLSTTQGWGAYVVNSGWYDAIFPDPVVTWTKQ